MKALKTFLLLAISVTLTFPILGCNGRTNSDVASDKMSQDGDIVNGIVGNFNEEQSKVTIDLGGQFYKQNIFDCHEYIGENSVGSDILRITIKPDGDKIVKAEKTICYYPTLWSAPEDDAIQFDYLFDLCYKYTKDLKVKDGVIFYPTSSNEGIDEGKSFFSKITQKELIASIKKISKEYEKKHTSLLHGGKHEEEVWLKKARNYKEGDFTSAINEPFDISPYDIKLVITFQGKDGAFTKTLTDEAVIGN